MTENKNHKNLMFGLKVNGQVVPETITSSPRSSKSKLRDINPAAVETAEQVEFKVFVHFDKEVKVT